MCKMSNAASWNEITSSHFMIKLNHKGILQSDTACSDFIIETKVLRSSETKTKSIISDCAVIFSTLRLSLVRTTASADILDSKRNQCMAHSLHTREAQRCIAIYFM